MNSDQRSFLMQTSPRTMRPPSFHSKCGAPWRPTEITHPPRPPAILLPLVILASLYPHALTLPSFLVRCCRSIHTHMGPHSTPGRFVVQRLVYRRRLPSMLPPKATLSPSPPMPSLSLVVPLQSLSLFPTMGRNSRVVVRPNKEVRLNHTMIVQSRPS